MSEPSDSKVTDTLLLWRVQLRPDPGFSVRVKERLHNDRNVLRGAVGWASVALVAIVVAGGAGFAWGRSHGVVARHMWAKAYVEELDPRIIIQRSQP